MKHIKNILVRSFCLILLLSYATHSMSQGKIDKRKEKMEALKIAYITEELDLTQEQWQVFWPIYNDYNKSKPHEKMEALKKQYESDPSSADEILTELMAIESLELERKHSYMSLLREKFGSDVVLKLNSLDQKFKHRLLRSYKERGKRKGN